MKLHALILLPVLSLPALAASEHAGHAHGAPVLVPVERP